MWPFRKKSPSNGWIKLARGAGIPARPGQKFDVRFTRHCEVYGLIAGKPSVNPVSDGGVVEYSGTTCGLWFDMDIGRVAYIAHYRLHRPSEISDDIAARAHMDNHIHDWTRDPGPEIERERFREKRPDRKPVRAR